MKQTKKFFTLHPVILLVLYLTNLVLILLFEIAFLHTLPVPDEPAALSEMEHFSECTILDQYGLTPEGTHADSILVLYQTKDEQVALVQIECSLYSDRCRILDNEIVLVPDDVSEFRCEFSQPLGSIVVTVSNRNDISAISDHGIVRSIPRAALFYSLTAIVLWFLELAVINLLSNMITRKRRNAA